MTSIKERLRTGKEPLAGFVNIIPSPVATQALASARADMLMIDQEHGPIGPESLHAMIASTAGTGCSPWVRVSRRDEASVKTALDAGAEESCFRWSQRPKAQPIALLLLDTRRKGGGDGAHLLRTRDGASISSTTSQREATRAFARS